jgi:hypothetical protein
MTEQTEPSQSPRTFNDTEYCKALEIVENIVQYQKLRSIVTGFSPFAFNIALINSYHETEQIMFAEIKRQIKAWESKYDKTFALKNFVSDYKRIRADYDRPVQQATTPDQDDPPTG